MHGVVRRRLLPPQPPAGCVPRNALVERLVASLDDRLVTVIAGAGYGKTTLLRLTLEQLRQPWVWCSCDERIDDGGLLLRHLSVGLDQRFPGFGARLTGSGTLREQIDDFCDEVADTVADDVVLILDDVHLLPEAAQEAVAALMHELPPVGHLALAGRAPMPLGLGRLRGGRILEIGEADLALSPAEAATLLAAVGMPLDDEEVALLHEDVEGWAAGLIMAAQAGGRGRPAQAQYLTGGGAARASRPMCSGSWSRPRCSTASRLRWPPRSPDGRTPPRSSATWWTGTSSPCGWRTASARATGTTTSSRPSSAGASTTSRRRLSAACTSARPRPSSLSARTSTPSPISSPRAIPPAPPTPWSPWPSRSSRARRPTACWSGWTPCRPRPGVDVRA